jgi:hypothetical protein
MFTPNLYHLIYMLDKSGLKIAKCSWYFSNADKQTVSRRLWEIPINLLFEAPQALVDPATRDISVALSGGTDCQLAGFGLTQPAGGTQDRTVTGG